MGRRTIADLERENEQLKNENDLLRQLIAELKKDINQPRPRDFEPYPPTRPRRDDYPRPRPMWLGKAEQKQPPFGSSLTSLY